MCVGGFFTVHEAYDGRKAEDIKIRLLTAWRSDGVYLCGSACTLNRFTVLAIITSG
jgi:hypothetical protein